MGVPQSMPGAAQAEAAGPESARDLLRFITCGSVDDGKSTLIGRLLWDSQELFDDQISGLKADSRRYGTQGDDIDFALLVDGLAAEREQGITIDVAYRYFSTPRRKFIVADTPGHEQYTRNMVTAASTADAAILLVDARHGILPQTRRHAHLIALMGIRHVALAVNKMDLIGYDRGVLENILAGFRAFAGGLGFTTVDALPLSALRGDNITRRSANTPWYQGPTLTEWLEGIEPAASPGERFVFPVQWVNRPDSTFRGFSGTVCEGSVRPGDAVRVAASGQTARVARIVTFDGDLERAAAGDAVTLTLDREIDVSRGDVLSLPQDPVPTTDQFEAWLVWMGSESGLVGRKYEIKLATQWAPASITGIKYRLDILTQAHAAARTLELNDICVCNLSLGKPLAFDAFDRSRDLGGFILVDRFTHATVAAGMIRHSLRRADNVHVQSLTVTRAERERLGGHRGRVVWLTGLSGAGKSTLANALESELHRRGMRTYLLDGDNMRHGLNKDLGFTDADRTENIRRVAEVARLMMDAGLIVFTAFISPFRQEREMARELIGPGDFFEIHVSTPLAVCERRDPKGLYRKARAGKLPHMTGIDSPYEAPEQAFLTFDLGAIGVDDAAQRAVEALWPAIAPDR